MTVQDSTARLLVTCPDCPGIVAAVSNFFYNHSANITGLDQYSSDPQDGTFFLRLEFQTPHIDLPKESLHRTFQQAVAQRYNMQWHISYAAERKKVVILVSKYDHALLELLWRKSRNELPCDISFIISNHLDLEKAANNFNIPYHFIQVDKDSKPQAEQKILQLLDNQADLIVLARYMQILSPELISHYPNKIINIHHSFLPAFAGANPYQQAYDKGVKIIGATAHYVTPELDMGPIIEQDIHRVTHKHTPKHLKEIGQDMERNVLARAVKWHLEDRIIVYKNKTIVFN